MVFYSWWSKKPYKNKEKIDLEVPRSTFFQFFSSSAGHFPLPWGHYRRGNEATSKTPKDPWRGRRIKHKNMTPHDPASQDILTWICACKCDFIGFFTWVYMVLYDLFGFIWFCSSDPQCGVVEVETCPFSISISISILKSKSKSKSKLTSKFKAKLHSHGNRNRNPPVGTSIEMEIEIEIAIEIHGFGCQNRWSWNRFRWPMEASEIESELEIETSFHFL